MLEATLEAAGHSKEEDEAAAESHDGCSSDAGSEGMEDGTSGINADVAVAADPAQGSGSGEHAPVEVKIRRRGDTFYADTCTAPAKRLAWMGSSCEHPWRT